MYHWATVLLFKRDDTFEYHINFGWIRGFLFHLLNIRLQHYQVDCHHDCTKTVLNYFTPFFNRWRQTCLCPPVIFLLTVPRRCFFCGLFLLFVVHVCLCDTILSAPCSLVVTCWERTGLLALLCVLSLSHMVSWVRCGTWLHRVLIFVFFHFSLYLMQDTCTGSVHVL